MPSRALRMLTLLLAPGAGAACDNGGVVDPGGNGGHIVAGLELSAVVHEIVHDFTDARQMMVRVTMTNTTGAPITIHYPAGCPVRIRLYRAGQATPAYDESRLACVVTTLVPLTVSARGSQSLQSGPRNPWDIGGDSLALGTYRVAGLVQLVGDAPVEVDAGDYVLGCTEQGGTVTCTMSAAFAAAGAIRRRKG